MSVRRRIERRLDEVIREKLLWFRADLSFTAPELRDLKFERFHGVLLTAVIAALDEVHALSTLEELWFKNNVDDDAVAVEDRLRVHRRPPND